MSKQEKLHQQNFAFLTFIADPPADNNPFYIVIVQNIPADFLVWIHDACMYGNDLNHQNWLWCCHSYISSQNK